MKRLLALLATSAAIVLAQVNLARIDGTVTDPQGAAVPGAEVVVTNIATAGSLKTTTNDRGEFAIPSLPAATYRVTVTVQGFKKATYDDIVLNSGVPATVNVKLELGQSTESVVVTAGAEIVQTTSAAVSNTIGGKQLFELPFATRNAVELLVTQPGVQTPTNPRSSSVNGLPRGALNVTIDGMNTQDNMLKSSDGFFSYIYPSVDSLDELTVTTSAGSADASGQGAAQIKFVTKGGTNEWHGGGFYQRRQTGWNANYYFNNQQNLPRDIVKLTQRGLHGGGPVLKNKLFLFANYEQYLLPGTKSYTRQVLTPDALKGLFTYNAGGVTRQVDLYKIAAAGGYTSTPDPVLLKTLQDESATAGQAGSTVQSRIANNNDYNRVDLNYQPTGNQTRHFLTSRIDYNLTSNHFLSFVYNYDKYISVPDFLNNVVAAFPGTGVVLGSDAQSGQYSNRFMGTLSLRSTFGGRITNELRAGLNGGTVLFFPEINPGLYNTWRGYRPVLGFVSAVTTSTSAQRRNSPVKDIADNMSLLKGSHQIAFGGTFTQVNSWQQIASTDTMPSISMGVVSGDPIITGSTNMFTSTATGNFPSATSTNLSDAEALYAALTGRVSSISKQLVLDEKTKQYSPVAPIDRNQMREYSFYGQDTWRAKPNLTLSFGMRYEKEGAFQNLNGLYSRVGYDSLWGLSGIGNLFKPGVLTGKLPVYNSVQGDAYAIPAQWAPSIGLAWQIPKADGFLGKIFGSHEGASVFRMGYNIATIREGQNVFISLWGSNQGITQTASVSYASTPSDFGAPGSVLFRQPSWPTKAGLVSTPSYPIAAAFNTSLNDFAPNLKLGYVQSWNIGFQRELTPNTVVEARYTGNHGLHQWRQYNLNEANIVENGFLNEFKIAQNNLRIARGGDITKNTGVVNFGNTGLAGQGPIPILQTALGTTSDNTTATYLMMGQAGASANSIATNSARMTNLTKANYPVNMFFVNPTVGNGGSYLLDNNGSSYYNAFQLELRRRLTRGLQAQTSYVFSKSMANGATNSSTSSSQPTTLRNLSMDKLPSGYDMRHAIKANWIYELPFGHGQRFLASGGNAVVRKIAEGWEVNGVVRVQSGLPFFPSSLGTFNQNGDGITLYNMDAKQLRQMVNIRKATNANGIGVVYYLPQNVIDNTMAAFNQGGKTPAMVDPTQPYIGPAATGQIGWRGYLYQNWNRFFDASVVKRTGIWREGMNLEFRATALNILNVTNFNSYNNVGSSFGQVAGAYRDISGTVEPGGRILEFMLRFNF
ncbi:MAG: carboxypeptidase-like regulatory domain-containing protein [Acidobacteriia bacterium]|nr:carboxypeptidase-like regulatory domain-containing protein [Terriglobia bacterium]